MALADQALAAIAELATQFEDDKTPYRAMRRPVSDLKRIYDYDAYEHLARLFADEDDERQD
jgi:hypothetical protein